MLMAVSASFQDLGPREIRILGREALSAKLVAGASLLTIRHTGLPGDFLATGAVINNSTGAGSNIHFLVGGTAVSNTLAGAHFLYGSTVPELAASNGQNYHFRAPLLLGNISTTPVIAIITVTYRADES